MTYFMERDRCDVCEHYRSDYCTLGKNTNWQQRYWWCTQEPVVTSVRRRLESGQTGEQRAVG